MATTFRVVDKVTLDSIKTIYVGPFATNITSFSEPWEVSPTLALARELDGRHLFSVIHLDSVETFRTDSIDRSGPYDAVRLAKSNSADAFIYGRIHYAQACLLDTPFGPILPWNSFEARTTLGVFKTSNGRLLAEFNFNTALGDPWTDPRPIDTMTVHVVKGVIDAMQEGLAHVRKSTSSSK